MKAFFEKLKALLVAYPQSYDDYLTFGRWLVYKKLPILLALLLAVVLAVVLFWTNRPVKPFTLPVFHEGEDALAAFSGEAIVLDADDAVIYRGAIREGLRSGNGKQFNPGLEAPVYEGDFLENRYSGEGVLYQGGKLVYEGGFLNGLYSGSGKLYNDDLLLYEGGFEAGLYGGRGVLFQGGRKVYEGGFLNGLYDGEGILFDDAGKTTYSGGFARGLRDGTGIEYARDGTSIYEGGFRNGLYEGQGKLFAPDGSRLAYEGVFLRGKPGLSGGVYNARGQLLYSGAMVEGTVDYVSLVGRRVSELREEIREVPYIYYDADDVAYLYRELGFAVIARHSRAEDAAPNPVESGTDWAESAAEGAPPPMIDTALLEAPGESLVANTLLIDGAVIFDRLPKGVAEQSAGPVSGFEAFVETRVARIRDPVYPELVRGAEVVNRGDHLYEVRELPYEAPYQGVRLFQEGISYTYRTGELQKGGVPEAIYCRKANFGG